MHLAGSVAVTERTYLPNNGFHEILKVHPQFGNHFARQELSLSKFAVFHRTKHCLVEVQQVCRGTYAQMYEKPENSFECLRKFLLKNVIPIVSEFTTSQDKQRHSGNDGAFQALQNLAVHKVSSSFLFLCAGTAPEDVE
ncbi:hypothetical protein AAES_181559 [Amazona aestiva]|uniref:Uncharacterized protein n=1 Tax=Amazona aestiva TaxID=12930 RepID=A0A0Q3X7Y7_AMAAE|nr:hypothetical protein AAES_181559 [Amazona aestiva]